MAGACKTQRGAGWMFIQFTVSAQFSNNLETYREMLFGEPCGIPGMSSGCCAVQEL